MSAKYWIGVFFGVALGFARVGRTQAAPAGNEPLRLSMADAEALALKNNPQITVARLNALAAGQSARETRSAFLPTLSGNLTGVEANAGTRITAGALNNPVIYDRAAAGALATQLLTDFGRTSNLVASARFRAAAADQNSIATAAQIVLAVDETFYRALEAGAVLKVAQQTVEERETVESQVKALAQSKLKSDLDLSFADVNVKQADLLLLDAKNNQKSAVAALSAILGSQDELDLDLVDDPAPPPAPPGDLNALISLALSRRPELLELDLEAKAAERFYRAERDLQLPSIRAVAAGGVAPYRNEHLSANYAAVGVNVEIPIFNGFLFDARRQESEFRAEAARSHLESLRNDVVRDVRTDWLDADTEYSRLSVTRDLLKQANQALDLAQTRYRLGLSSIVELSQAQLQQTAALIEDAQARYRYRASQAILRFATGGS